MRVLCCLLMVLLVSCGSGSNNTSQTDRMRDAGIDVSIEEGAYKLSEPLVFLKSAGATEDSREVTLTHMKLANVTASHLLERNYKYLISLFSESEAALNLTVSYAIYMSPDSGDYYVQDELSYGTVNAIYSSPTGEIACQNLGCNNFFDPKVIGLNEYGFSYIKSEREADTLIFNCSNLDDVSDENITNSGNIADIIYNPYADIPEEYEDDVAKLCENTSRESVEIEVEAQTLFKDYLWEYDAELTTQMEDLD